jgi:hypothetical protein
MQQFAGYSYAAAITPSDTANPLTALAGNKMFAIRAIYVGGAGDVAIKTPNGGGTAVTFKAVPVGTILPVQAAFVMATNTTATLLIGLGT